MKAKAQTTLVLVVILVIIVTGMLMLSGCNVVDTISAEPTDANAREYADLASLVQSESSYTADDVAKADYILSSLPRLSVFHEQSSLSLDEGVLTVYYEYNYSEQESAFNPFIPSDAENNALILFAFMKDLDTVTFSFDDGNTPAEYSPRYSFTRADFIQKYGDPAALREDLPRFHKILDDNLLINPDYPHYNRIRLGGDMELVSYRNGEPDETIRNSDGSFQMIYQNLGEVTSRSLDDPDQTSVIPGDNVTFFMDYPAEAVSPQTLRGVCKIQVTAASGAETPITEILWRVGIEENNYDEIISKLGKPTNTFKDVNGATHVFYLMKDTDHHYLYCVFQDGKLIEHGLTAMKEDWEKLS